MPSRNKYRAQPVVVDGIRFASKREARRYGELQVLLKAGKIQNLIIQPTFPIEINGNPVLIKSKGYPNGRKLKYIADFSYYEGITRIVEDSKGYDNQVSKIKRALVLATHDLEIRLV